MPEIDALANSTGVSSGSVLYVVNSRDLPSRVHEDAWYTADPPSAGTEYSPRVRASREWLLSSMFPLALSVLADDALALYEREAILARHRRDINRPSDAPDRDHEALGGNRCANEEDRKIDAVL